MQRESIGSTRAGSRTRESEVTVSAVGDPPRRRPRRGVGAPFALGVLAAEVAAANQRLETLGARRRVSAPTGARDDRERISKDLFLALRETRDRRLFDLVYRLNRPLLWAYCRDRVRRGPVRLNPIEILDDTFLLLWLRLDNFQDRPDSTFTGWMFAIAEHLALSAARVRRRDARRELDLQRCAPKDAEIGDADRVADAELPVIHESDCRWLIVLFAAGLERLPPSSRRILELRDVEGRDYTEIARLLGVTRGCVAMRLRRARKRLLEELRARLSPPPARRGSRGKKYTLRSELAPGGAP